MGPGRRPPRGGVYRNLGRATVLFDIQVAPRAGAWIETLTGLVWWKDAGGSPLARGRGLKLLWEIDTDGSGVSPLARGRGLKQERRRRAHPAPGSPLARGRGLKPRPCPVLFDVQVAPRAGAWIETTRRSCRS